MQSLDPACGGFTTRPLDAQVCAGPKAYRRSGKNVIPEERANVEELTLFDIGSCTPLAETETPLSGNEDVFEDSVEGFEENSEGVDISAKELSNMSIYLSQIEETKEKDSPKDNENAKAKIPCRYFRRGFVDTVPKELTL